ncbi:hypothetical protein RB195_014611 [Necator americanus]|uniref:Uncharacterized protein n=1 Tax=Necator americanus TaxID=51031 RepID=A0ABR1E0X3_NECAM
MQAHTGREDEKDKYRTCCAVCHIKFGTAVLGVIEAVVCVTVLISAVQQVIWKSGGSQDCFQKASKMFADDEKVLSNDAAREFDLQKRMDYGERQVGVYKGQYDENKPKKAPKQKNFHVQWREKSAAIEEEEDDTTMNLIEYETEPKSDFHEPLIKMESVDETTKSTSKKNSQSELLRKTSSQEAGRISHAHSSFDQPTTSKTSTASSEVQSLRSHHKESHASTSSHRRLSDMPSQEFDNTGAFAKLVP